MIKRLYVHNFRCLENFELLLSGQPSALLIGKNGSGKSTVGLALQVLQSIARGTNRVSQLLTPEHFARNRSDVPLRLEIEALLAGQEYRYTLALELPAGFRELRVAEEMLSQDGQPVYSRDRAQIVLRRDAKNRVAKFLVDWHLIALPIIQEQSDSDPLHVFKSWLARMLILAPLPSLISGDSTGDTLMPNRAVTDFGAWFSGLLAHSPAAYTQIDTYLTRVLPDFKDIKNPMIGKDARSLTVQFYQDGTAMNLPFRELSDGEKCIFVGALVLAANKAYGPLFCFWDEPDSHLSLSEVSHFVMTLRREFQSGGQVLVTSHNPEAIRAFSEENSLLLYRHSHLEPTLVRPIRELQVHGDLVNALIRDDLKP